MIGFLIFWSFSVFLLVFNWICILNLETDRQNLIRLWIQWTHEVWEIKIMCELCNLNRESQAPNHRVVDRGIRMFVCPIHELLIFQSLWPLKSILNSLSSWSQGELLNYRIIDCHKDFFSNFDLHHMDKGPIVHWFFFLSVVIIFTATSDNQFWVYRIFLIS